MIIISIIFIMLTVAIVNKQKMISLFFGRISIALLLYCVLQIALSFFSLYKDISLQGGLLYISNIIQSFEVFILIVSAIILQLTSFYPNKFYIKTLLGGSIDKEYFNNAETKPLLNTIVEFDNKLYASMKIVEYPLIILFTLTGSLFLMSTNDLVSLFLSIELQSYGLYLLSSLNKNSEFSTSGGLIYFLLGSLSSCFILLGISLLYANSGTTNLDGLYVITSLSDINNVWYKPFYINFSLSILTIGLLFKVSAAPFHFWAPDVYDSIPTVVTTFVAIVGKISIFILLLQLVTYINNISTLGEINWTFCLLLSSLCSLIIGTVGGLTQFRIKRLYAYSTISHIGFILLALSISSVESIQAFLFYLMQYSISNLNAFIILIAIGTYLYYYSNNNTQELKDKTNSPIQIVNQLSGLHYINPFLALSLTITVFSFAGIPPLMGFFGKQMVLSAALDKGYFLLSLVAILTSVIGALYYLNIIKEMYFFTSQDKFFDVWSRNNFYFYKSKQVFVPKITLTGFICFNISTITLIILLFMFIGNREWLRMGTILVQILFNT